MVEATQREISIERGLEGDHKGLKSRTRAVTVLSYEDWEAACMGLWASAGAGEALASVGARQFADSDGAIDCAAAGVLPWTARRANLLVNGLRLPRAPGAVLAIGNVRLQVTGQTYPCHRMEEARPGLLKALSVEWRGGLTCSVLEAGTISIDDRVEIISSPPERQRRLPG